MKRFDQYIIQPKDYFLKITHLDDLVIGFDFIKYDNDMIYFYENKFFFIQNKKTKIFVINEILWEDIQYKYGYCHDIMTYFITDLVEKYFNIKGYKIIHLIGDYIK
ncbi:hypothetical protein M0Q50_02330 [bacterium]|jgi:hypothetical protein|nr:hypothetical protein [bacterium]